MHKANISGPTAIEPIPGDEDGGARVVRILAAPDYIIEAMFDKEFIEEYVVPRLTMPVEELKKVLGKEQVEQRATAARKSSLIVP